MSFDSLGHQEFWVYGRVTSPTSMIIDHCISAQRHNIRTNCQGSRPATELGDYHRSRLPPRYVGEVPSRRSSAGECLPIFAGKNRCNVWHILELRCTVRSDIFINSSKYLVADKSVAVSNFLSSTTLYVLDLFIQLNASETRSLPLRTWARYRASRITRRNKTTLKEKRSLCWAI